MVAVALEGIARGGPVRDSEQTLAKKPACYLHAFNVGLARRGYLGAAWLRSLCCQWHILRYQAKSYYVYFEL